MKSNPPAAASGSVDALIGHLFPEHARSRIMHHKFALADGTFLWTGSDNLTERSFCTDFNDALVIEQPAIVAAYEALFDRIFTRRQFGPRTPQPYRRKTKAN